MYEYDIAVIGAGPAGYEIAGLLAAGGKSVSLVEQSEERVGGTCLTEGCVPAKNFLENAAYLAKSTYFRTTGLDMQLADFDLLQLQQHTEALISQMQAGIQSKLKRVKVQMRYGTASFVDAHTIILESGEQISAENFIIATGSSHREHPLLPLDGVHVISSREVFALQRIPSSVLVIGAGAIGCEFATFFHAMGAEVTLAEYAPRILPGEDEDISRTLKRELEKKGIRVYVDAEVTASKSISDGVEIEMRVGKKELKGEHEKILVSIGRVPHTSGLNLEAAGVETERGFVQVDEDCRSVSAAHIFAIGDVIATPALAHVAYYEAKRLARLLLDQEPLPPHPIFPSVTFCIPQVASIGALEQTLKAAKTPYKSKKLFFKANAKAKIKGDDSGFVKILYDPESEVILGAAIIGHDATEQIHQFLIAIHEQSTLKALSEMIFAHPTLSEVVVG